MQIYNNNIYNNLPLDSHLTSACQRRQFCSASISSRNCMSTCKFRSFLCKPKQQKSVQSAPLVHMQTQKTNSVFLVMIWRLWCYLQWQCTCLFFVHILLIRHRNKQYCLVVSISIYLNCVQRWLVNPLCPLDPLLVSVLVKIGNCANFLTVTSVTVHSKCP